MRILIIALSNLKNDPRVFRQISWLSQTHEVTCMGYQGPDIGKVRVIQIAPPLRTRFERISLIMQLFAHRYDEFLRKKFRNLFNLDQILLAEEFDVIIANDIDTLPFALEIKKTAKILFDAHEYYPKEFEDLWVWKFLYQDYRIYQCRRYLNLADMMITICDGIALEYAKNYSVKPEVITNASPFSRMYPSSVRSDSIRIIHHGGVNPSRKIENMIEMMDFVDRRFSLDLMLLPPDGDQLYYKKIVSMAETRQNVSIIPPVTMHEIIQKTNMYDIGLFLLEPTNFKGIVAI